MIPKERAVTQTDNTVLGDQAGGDIFKTNINYNAGHVRVTKIKELFKKLQEEKESNTKFNEIIEELEHFRTSKKGEKVVGLEEKLRIGNREDFIEYALEVKESYAKKLVRNQLYESAQKINVFLLAMIRTYYMNHVYPLVLSKASEVAISAAVNNHIIQPLLEQLDGDTLGFTPDDIHGMLYFLTGNCHLKWAK